MTMGALTPAAPTTPATTGRRAWLVILLDRTGSMAPLKRETQTAFDHFIATQRQATAELGDDVRVSLAQFDAYSGQPPVEIVYRDLPLTDVPPLQLVPRGSTPLNDAMGSTITQVRADLDWLPPERRPAKVIFVTITDGEENASREYKLDQVKALVDAETANGWDFVFLGVGIDAFSVASGYGVAAGSTVSVAATASGTQSGYAQTSRVVYDSRSSSGSASWKVDEDTP
jgi:hypothetical protein